MKEGDCERVACEVKLNVEEAEQERRMFWHVYGCALNYGLSLLWCTSLSFYAPSRDEGYSSTSAETRLRMAKVGHMNPYLIWADDQHVHTEAADLESLRLSWARMNVRHTRRNREVERGPT